MNKVQKKEADVKYTRESNEIRKKKIRRYSTCVQKKKWKDTKEKIWIFFQVTVNHGNKTE